MELCMYLLLIKYEGMFVVICIYFMFYLLRCHETQYLLLDVFFFSKYYFYVQKLK